MFVMLFHLPYGIVMMQAEKERRQTEYVNNTTLPSLQLLWSFKCDVVKGRHINYMAWNNKDPVLIFCYCVTL